MRSLVPLTLLALAIVAVASTRSASASQAPPHQPLPAVVARQVDDNDDSRVDVQLVVAGVAAAVVVGLGSVAYAIRWKLGRTAYDRDAAEKAMGHH